MASNAVRPYDPASARFFVLLLLVLCDVFAMATWFSTTAVLSSISAWFGVSPSDGGWITAGVQAGFVIGALGSAATALGDSVDSRALIRCGVLIAASANAAIPFAHGLVSLIALRFITGFGLALVYPPTIRLLGAWFVKDRGLAMGAIIGALTVGSFCPHLLTTAPLDWRWVVYGSSAIACAAIPVTVLLPPAPESRVSLHFDSRAVLHVLRSRAVVLAGCGYCGHMWELYAVWAWAPAFFAASLREAHASALPVGTIVFLAFGIMGAAGCVCAGAIADRIGRARVAAAAMIASGTISFCIGWLYGADPLVLSAVLVLWGFTVIADSAQFSAAVSELCDRDYVGTALTLQMGIGFSITMLTIWGVGMLQAHLGWRLAFATLAVGPALGVVAMLLLKHLYPNRV